MTTIALITAILAKAIDAQRLIIFTLKKLAIIGLDIASQIGRQLSRTLVTAKAISVIVLVLESDRRRRLCGQNTLRTLVTLLAKLVGITSLAARLVFVVLVDLICLGRIQLV